MVGNSKKTPAHSHTTGKKPSRAPRKTVAKTPVVNAQSGPPPSTNQNSNVESYAVAPTSQPPTGTSRKRPRDEHDDSPLSEKESMSNKKKVKTSAGPKVAPKRAVKKRKHEDNESSSSSPEKSSSGKEEMPITKKKKKAWGATHSLVSKGNYAALPVNPPEPVAKSTTPFSPSGGEEERDDVSSKSVKAKRPRAYNRNPKIKKELEEGAAPYGYRKDGQPRKIRPKQISGPEPDDSKSQVPKKKRGRKPKAQAEKLKTQIDDGSKTHGPQAPQVVLNEQSSEGVRKRDQKDAGSEDPDSLPAKRTAKRPRIEEPTDGAIKDSVESDEERPAVGGVASVMPSPKPALKDGTPSDGNKELSSSLAPYAMTPPPENCCKPLRRIAKDARMPKREMKRLLNLPQPQESDEGDVSDVDEEDAPRPKRHAIRYSEEELYQIDKAKVQQHDDEMVLRYEKVAEINKKITDCFESEVLPDQHSLIRGLYHEPADPTERINSWEINRDNMRLALEELESLCVKKDAIETAISEWDLEFCRTFPQEGRGDVAASRRTTREQMLQNAYHPQDK